MSEVKVIQAFTKEGTIFGLTDEGHLVWFDTQVNKWVFRGSNLVLDAERAVMIKSASFAGPEIVVLPPKKIGVYARFIKCLLKFYKSVCRW